MSHRSGQVSAEVAGITQLLLLPGFVTIFFHFDDFFGFCLCHCFSSDISQSMLQLLQSSSVGDPGWQAIFCQASSDEAVVLAWCRFETMLPPRHGVRPGTRTQGFVISNALCISESQVKSIQPFGMESETGQKENSQKQLQITAVSQCSGYN